MCACMHMSMCFSGYMYGYIQCLYMHAFCVCLYAYSILYLAYDCMYVMCTLHAYKHAYRVYACMNKDKEGSIKDFSTASILEFTIYFTEPVNEVGQSWCAPFLC